MPDLPAALPPDLKPVPAECEDAWTKIQEREPAKMVDALRLVLSGESPSRAATEAGYAHGSRHDVYLRAKHYGIYKPKAEQIADEAREVASITGQDLIHTLLNDPGSIDPKQKAVLWGIAQDKVLKLEQMRKGDHGQAAYILQDVIHGLLEQGGGTIELSVKPPDPLDQATTIQAENEPEPE